MHSESETIVLNPEQKSFIEDVGVFFVGLHIPRIAGKILGYLLISTPSYQTAGQMLTAIGGSKGSISTMTRFLMQNDFIELVGIPGKRDNFYQIKANSVTQWLLARVSFINTLHELADRALQLSSKDDPRQLQWLQDVHDLNAFFQRELPILMERWMKEKHDNSEKLSNSLL